MADDGHALQVSNSQPQPSSRLEEPSQDNPIQSGLSSSLTQTEGKPSRPDLPRNPTQPSHGAPADPPSARLRRWPPRASACGHHTPSARQTPDLAPSGTKGPLQPSLSSPEQSDWVLVCPKGSGDVVSTEDGTRCHSLLPQALCQAQLRQ